MRTLGLVILAFSIGMLKAHHICRKSDSEACLPEDRNPPPFPGTEEQLQDACKFFRNVLQCLVEYVDKCGARNVHIMDATGGRLDRIIETHQEICQASSLQTDLVESLPCIKNIIENDDDLCQERTRNAFVQLQRTMADKVTTGQNNIFEVFDCLFPVLHINCFAIQTETKCGSRARNTVLAIIQGLELLNEECLDTMRDEALEMLEVIEFLTDQKIHVKNLL
ncbi:uncharacterized protein CEXT_508651 [Caerostris extrusa]|uniref:Secreted protein n=1 Tax=Caerostris extrusa TaxID=172846 RepID=A0AAV4T999_CAEEX|nr:uncharacterized protein CEXT_508651 [Caerostris extrusa]